MDMQCEARNCNTTFSTDDGDEHYCKYCDKWVCAYHFRVLHSEHDEPLQKEADDWRLMYQR